MKELQLNINKAFYSVVCLFALGIIIIANIVGSVLNVTFNHAEILISVCLLVSCFIYLGLSVSGLRRVTFCPQGIFYINFFGQKRYVLVEHVHKVEVVSFVGFKVTKIKLEHSSLIFVAFNPCSKQAVRLKAFGYSVA